MLAHKFLITAFSIVSFSAFAEDLEFAAVTGQLIPGRCHMDECGWTAIDTIGLIGSSPKGQLFVLATRAFSAHYPGGNYDRPAKKTGGDKAAVSFVFCSKSNAALIDLTEDGKWLASKLRPGDETSVYGYNESGLSFYWAACHRAIVKDVYAGGTQLGKKLGYRNAWDSNGDMQGPIASPFDALKW
jgi:hypothetical protein